MTLKVGVCLLLGMFSVRADGDPSRVPLPDPAQEGKFVERFRVLVDLDGDEEDDMLLSGGPQEFGTMGGPWAVFLKRKDGFVRVGEVWAHPGAIAIEADQARIRREPDRRYARIWVCLRASGSAGALGYYRVGERVVDELNSIEVYPGDGGTVLGNAIYEATFAKSPIPFRVERSVTGADGRVSWGAGDR